MRAPGFYENFCSHSLQTLTPEGTDHISKYV